MMVLTFFVIQYLKTVYTILSKTAIVGQNKMGSVLRYSGKKRYAYIENN